MTPNPAPRITRITAVALLAGRRCAGTVEVVVQVPITIDNAEQVGRGYLSAHREDPDGWWVITSVWLGEGLDNDTHLALVLGALAAATTDEELWRIGDQPVEEGLAPRPGMIRRLQILRDENAAVDRLWVVMQRYHAEVTGDRTTFWHVGPSSERP